MKKAKPDFIEEHNIERILIGSVLFNPEVAAICCVRVKSEMFRHMNYKAIWKAIEELTLQRVELSVSNLTIKTGLNAYVFGEFEGQWTEDIDFLLDSITEKYRIEVEGLIAERMAFSFRDGTLNEETIQALNAERGRALDITNVTERIDDKERKEKWATSLLERVKNGNKLTGVHTGHQDINDLLGGWNNGDLIIVGARPSIGKTATGLHFIMQAKRVKAPAGIVSVEMDFASIWNRVVAYESGVDSVKVRAGNLKGAELDAVIQSAARLEAEKIFVETNISKLEPILNRMGQRTITEGIKLWVVDYLQLIGDPKYKDKRLEVGEIALRMKLFAKTYSVPVILLSQLKRLDGKRPRMEDLRETGEIEAHADVIALLSNDVSGATDDLFFDICKNRNGPIGMVIKQYNKPTGQITDQPFPDGLK